MATLLGALLALLVLPAAAGAAADTRLVIRQEPGLSTAEQREVRDDAGVRLVATLPIPGVQVVDPIGNEQLSLALLQADPDVVWAEVDGVSHGSSDPGVAQQWALYNAGQSVAGVRGTPGADISGLRARQVASGAGVAVGVVDSGAQLDHPDLRLTGNPGERGNGREANGIDDDRNGRVDDWRGWDFLAADNLPSDGNGHGTHVAGIVAAGENGTGIVGVAPEAAVVPLRALDDNEVGANSAVAAAFAYAGDQGIRVVNASLDSDSPSLAQLDAIRTHPNTLYVVAAGNSGRELGLINPTYPCGLPLDNVLCVGASDQFDDRASYSNYGAFTVDLFAPGEAILSDWLGGGTALARGTSMASPQVAGVAALLLSRNPALSTAALRRALVGSVDVRPGLAASVSGGRLDAAAALEAIGVPVPALSPSMVPDAGTVPPGPAPPPPGSSTPRPSGSGSGPAAGPQRASSGLRLGRPSRSTRRRTATITGTVSRLATGSVAASLKLRLSGGGTRTLKGSGRIVKGRFTVTVKLSSTSLKAPSGRWTVTYGGNAAVAAATVSASAR